MNARDEALERVAGAITDGRPVAWESEKLARPELGESLNVLRQLDVMARVHLESSGDTVEMSIDSPALRSWRHLRIVGKIGDGGFGDVYRAYDPMLKVEVALKLFREGRTPAGFTEEQFLDEAQHLAKLRHPSLLTVHGADRHEGRAGMWTELLEGETLEAMLERQGTMGPREAAAIGLDLCGALAAIHGAGLAHRDVKTENVMRERGGRIVLLDLGCSLELPLGGGEHHSTSIRGTPLTMAPEQLQGRTAGPMTDIYGLGVLLYRLVTRSYPVEGTTFYELVNKHTAEEYVRLRDRRADLPAEFIRVVEKAIDADPAKRYQTAGDMERALTVAGGAAPSDHFLAEPNVNGGAIPVRPSLWRTVLRWLVGRPAGRVTAAVAALAMIAGLWLGGRPRPSPVAVGSSESVAPATTAAGPSPTAFTVKAELFRERNGAHERLSPGSQVAPGDEMFLEIEATRDLYTYVLNEDRKGKTFILFPTPSFEQKNPVPGGRLHRLPGTRDGKLLKWVVTSSGGDESVVVICSAIPLVNLEQDLAGIPVAAEGAPVEYAEVSEATKQQIYRGIGGLMVSAAPTEAGQPSVLAPIMRSLPGGSRPVDSVWVWQIQLSNP